MTPFHFKNKWFQNGRILYYSTGGKWTRSLMEFVGKVEQTNVDII